MLHLIDGLPEYVVGVEADGRVTSADYSEVLIPALDAALAGHPKVRILYVLHEDWPDYSAGAMWADTKVGLGHLRSWERIAIVSDGDWLRRSIDALGWAIPGEVKVFASGERRDAERWVAERTDD